MKIRNQNKIWSIIRESKPTSAIFFFLFLLKWYTGISMYHHVVDLPESRSLTSRKLPFYLKKREREREEKKPATSSHTNIFSCLFVLSNHSKVESIIQKIFPFPQTLYIVFLNTFGKFCLVGTFFSGNIFKTIINGRINLKNKSNI